MPRRTRMYLPGFPYHVVQRGNNRDACFFNSEDYRCYLRLLALCLRRYRVALHAFVLMTNHVHFLLTPEDETGISNVMKVVGSNYARIINKKYQRTGTLWEGRHKAGVVETSEYLLACYRYIELNPVRAGMVTQPDAYGWSSHRVNAGAEESSVVSPHDEYIALSSDERTRHLAYRSLFSEALSPEYTETIRAATHYCHPIGGKAFRSLIEQLLGREIGYMERGRPRKAVLVKI